MKWQNLAIAVTAMVLISAPVALAASLPTDVIVTRHYHHKGWYRNIGYRSHGTLPYDGYPPYPRPIYHCPYFGSPIPLYPYCWPWYGG